MEGSPSSSTTPAPPNSSPTLISTICRRCPRCWETTLPTGRTWWSAGARTSCTRRPWDCQAWSGPKLVGRARFELAVSWSQTRRFSELSYRPLCFRRIEAEKHEDACRRPIKCGDSPAVHRYIARTLSIDNPMPPAPEPPATPPPEAPPFAPMPAPPEYGAPPPPAPRHGRGPLAAIVLVALLLILVGGGSALHRVVHGNGQVHS